MKDREHKTIATLEEVLVSGNLANLNNNQRIDYYNKLCETLKLNPLTKPFEYITLNGKLTLYARKDCTDQLRKVNGISIYKIETKTENDVYIVTAYARDSQGREDVSTGVVNICGLKGENLANAYMKCETKSKRRVTLSIGGLGMLDETEIESIRASNPKSVNENHFQETAITGEELHKKICHQIKSIETESDLESYEKWKRINKSSLQNLISSRPELANTYKEMLNKQLENCSVPDFIDDSYNDRINRLQLPFEQSQLAERLTFSM